MERKDKIPREEAKALVWHHAATWSYLKLERVTGWDFEDLKLMYDESFNANHGDPRTEKTRRKKHEQI